MTAKLDIQRSQWMLAAISGILLFLSFPKFDQGWLAWFALVPLMLALRRAQWRAGLVLGFTTGLIHNLGMMYWTVYVMHVYGMVPLVEAILILILLAGVMSLYTAAFAGGLCRLVRRPWQLAVLAPALWVTLEWLRGWLFTGFPWELLGYSQYDHVWVIQIADLAGVLGISALIVFANAVLSLALLFWAEKPWQTGAVSRKLTARSAVVLAAVLIMTAGYGIVRIRAVDRLTAQAPKVKVAVVQGNIAQDQKWDASFQVLTTAKYRTLSQEAVKQGAQLVIWPETATPFFMFYDKVLTGMVLQGIREAGVSFIIGSPSVDLSGKTPINYNSAYLISPRGETLGRYDKVHLVPFGEYVPLKRFLPFIDKLVAQVGDFRAGNRGNTLNWQQHPIGMLICYEAIFPGLARDMVRNGAQLLVNITNDAWFGRTSAAYQHFSMAVLRSVENRRVLARAANTGISGFIDPCGRVKGATALYQDSILTADVALLNSRTFYSRRGDAPLLTACLILLGLAAGRQALRAKTGRRFR